jgi:hypothetical protein
LKLEELSNGAKVVAEVEGARRLNSGENAHLVPQVEAGDCTTPAQAPRDPFPRSTPIC